MKSLLIFGTGLSSEKVLASLIEGTYTIEAFVDNAIEKQGLSFHNKEIIAPEYIIKYFYDFIIIASIKYREINKQLLDLGIDKNCIINYFDFDSRQLKNHLDIINPKNLLFDVYDTLALKIKGLEDRFSNLERRYKNLDNNIGYELVDKINYSIIKLPIVRDATDTILKIINDKVSVSRFGNGEFDLILGKEERFQHADARLAERLCEVLISNHSGHIVAISNFWGNLDYLRESTKEWNRGYLSNYRELLYQKLDMNKEYYDAYVTRPYLMMKDKSGSKERFNLIKRIWENREIVLIEGEESRLGVGNDLFDNAVSIERILGPKENAFDRYEELLAAALTISKSKLILLALGATSTVLAYDLSLAGYQAVDIGHIDIEYEWFLMGATEYTPVKNKYTDGIQDKNTMSDFRDEKYCRQIIKKIC